MAFQDVQLVDDSFAEQAESTAFLPENSSPAKLEKKSLADIVGYVFVVFPLYSMRIPALLLVPWLWDMIAIDNFVPVVSPVYREAEHWQTPDKRTAIVLHICFGSALLILGLFQTDQTFRHQHKWWHRAMGYAYVVCGLVTIGSLQMLQNSVGAGAGDTPSVALAWFVNATSAGWIAVTFCGVLAARYQRIGYHRNCMRSSVALTAAPIAQRMFSWFICAPLGMGSRIFLCTVREYSMRHSTPLSVGWDLVHVRWGGSNETLWGSGCLLSDETHHALTRDSPRDRPFVLSADGYGEGEQRTFAISAWMGLFGMTIVSLAPLMLKPEKAAQLQKAMSEAATLDLMRNAYFNVIALFNEIEQKFGQKTGLARLVIAVGLACLLGATAAFGAVAAAVGIVVLTLGVTAIVLSVSLSGAFMFVGLLHLGSTIVGYPN